MRRIGWAAWCAPWIVFAPTDLAAQQNATTCASVYENAFDSSMPTGVDACQVLAGELLGLLTDDFWVAARGEIDVEDRVADGDVQPASSGPATAAGSVAQNEAVPSVQPLAVGGGSVSAVGSDAGADAITALTFNPAIFAGGNTESVARMSRLSDVTVFFPVDDLDRDDDGDIDYFGFRVRVNFTGLSAGSAVWNAARTRFEDLLEAESEAAGELLGLLRSMSEAQMRSCVQVFRSGLPPAAIEAACGAGLATPTPAEYEAFRDELDRVRTVADSRYFGLDLRLDFGDPTLGVVPNAEATAINAGVAFGKQFVGSDPDPLAPSGGLRARAGLRYTDLRDLDETSLAIDGGIGFVAKRPVTVEQALTISAGVEFRFGGVDEPLVGPFQSEFLSIRAGLTVPLTPGTDIGIGFARPIIGDEVSPSLSVTGAWKLLLPGLLG